MESCGLHEEVAFSPSLKWPWLMDMECIHIESELHDVKALSATLGRSPEISLLYYTFYSTVTLCFLGLPCALLLLASHSNIWCPVLVSSHLGILYSGCPCLWFHTKSLWIYLTNRPWEFRQIYNLDAVGHKDELITFGCQRSQWDQVWFKSTLGILKVMCSNVKVTTFLVNTYWSPSKTTGFVSRSSDI